MRNIVGNSGATPHHPETARIAELMAHYQGHAHGFWRRLAGSGYGNDEIAKFVQD
jgi:hypothetical protein